MKNIRKMTSCMMILITILLLLTSGCAKQPLPEDPDTLKGTLSNGLSYYIRENQTPEKAASLRLVVKCGSIFETEQEQGLAHFLEHMAFNGTEKYPENKLVDFLQSMGIQFGPEINAYTSFEETVYQLEIPTDKPEVLKTAIEVLKEWAFYITLNPEEVEKEKGVVIEEWRSGLDAYRRAQDQYLPMIFKDSIYAKRLPIGKPEVITAFNKETVSDFYKRWYTPSRMAVIIVGDIKANEVLTTIKNEFSVEKVAENETPDRFFAPQEDNQLKIIKDTEFTTSDFIIWRPFKPVIPNTKQKYDQLLSYDMFTRIFSNRIGDKIKEGTNTTLDFNSGYYNFGSSADLLSISALFPENKISDCYSQVMTEMRKLQLYGPSKQEITRAATEILADAENQYKSRKTVQSNHFVSSYIDCFLQNKNDPSAEWEFNRIKKVLPSITKSKLDNIAQTFLSNEGRVTILLSPDKPKIEIPDEKTLKILSDSISGMDIQNNEIEYSNRNLEYSLPDAGKIKGTEKDKDLNVEILTLSNGVKVYLKKTDYQNNEIQFQAISRGGLSMANDEIFYSADFADAYVSGSGIGGLTRSELDRLKNSEMFNLDPFIQDLYEGFSGYSSSTDFERLFQMTYLYFTDVKKDELSYTRILRESVENAKNLENDPTQYFNNKIIDFLSSGNFRKMPATVENLSKVSEEDALDFFKERFNNIADFEFYIAGDFNINQAKEFCKKYLAGIPTATEKEEWKIRAKPYPSKSYKLDTRKGKEKKALTELFYYGKSDFNIRNKELTNALCFMLEEELNKLIREDSSGTYSISAFGKLKNEPFNEYIVTIAFYCEPSRVKELTDKINSKISDFKAGKIDSTNLDNYRKIITEKRKKDKQTNGFWLNSFQQLYTGYTDKNSIINIESLNDSFTIKEIQQKASEYFKDSGKLEALLLPE